MAEFVYIFSDMNPGKTGEPSTTAMDRAQELGAKCYNAMDLEILVLIFKELKSRSAWIDRMVIETHGSPGTMYIGRTPVEITSLSMFAGKGFEDLFAENARIFLNGCNIAANAKSCAPTSCTVIDGKLFLCEFARIFLNKGGGRVGASTSLGNVFAGLSSKVFHLPNTYYAYIKKGGSQARIVGGTELGKPDGDWFVMEGATKWLYRFYYDGTVRYQDPNKLISKLNILSFEDNKGTWSKQGDAIRIEWQSKTVEIWELPLFDGYQNVVWKRFDGRVQSLIAKRTYIGEDMLG